MKKLNYSTYLIFPLLLVLLFGCGSDKFDYRNKYTGDFEVTGSMSYPREVGPGNTTSILSAATVEFAEEDENDDKLIRINIIDWDIHITSPIDRKGKLTADIAGFVGAFKDKDHFDLSSQGTTMTMQYVEWDLHGVRK